MTNIFYAVQHGNDFDWDFGSESYSKALDMANRMIDDPYYDGEEIRIATIDCDTNFCSDEEIVRDGSRV